MNREKEFWNNKGAELYADGKYDNEDISKYEFDILSRLNINSGDVLEIGPGSGRDIRKFKGLGFSLNAIDISKFFIDNLNETEDGKFIEADLRDVSSLFSNVNLIYSRWSILFLKYGEFKTFLSEASKVLGKGGHILMSLRAGDSLENIHAGTGLQSLQMNAKNLMEAIPKSLEIEFLELKPFKSMRSQYDKQICFVLKKKIKDNREGIYKG